MSFPTKPNGEPDIFTPKYMGYNYQKALDENKALKAEIAELMRRIEKATGHSGKASTTMPVFTPGTGHSDGNAGD